MKRIIILGVVVVVIVGLWSAAWLYASALIRQNVVALAAGDGQATPKLTCDRLDVGGWPLYFDVTCSGMAIVSGDLTANVAQVKASAEVYDPWHVVAFLTGPLTLEDAFTGSKERLDWKSLEASAHLIGWRIGRVSIVGETLALTDTVGSDVPLGSAGHAELHLLDLVERHDTTKGLAALRVYATIGKLDAPGLGIAGGKATLNAIVDGLPDDVRTYGDPDLLQRWQAAGGKVTLTSLKGGDGGATSFDVAGTLALDSAARPAGQLTITSKGLVERFGGLVPEQWRGVVLGSPAADGSYKQVLNLTNGVLFSGLLPLGPLPSLQ